MLSCTSSDPTLRVGSGHGPNRGEPVHGRADAAAQRTDLAALAGRPAAALHGAPACRKGPGTVTGLASPAQVTYANDTHMSAIILLITHTESYERERSFGSQSESALRPGKHGVWRH